MPETKRHKDMPKILRLRHYGDPILWQKARPVAAPAPEILALAEDMIATMYDSDGIGLAAPQIGHAIRLIVVDVRSAQPEAWPPRSPGEQMLTARMPLVLLNPRILESSPDREICEEGCLSLPDIHGPVERPATVLLQATLADGSEIRTECGRLFARCLQHEIDHLDGITFDRRLPAGVTEKLRPQLDGLEKRTRKRLRRNS